MNSSFDARQFEYCPNELLRDNVDKSIAVDGIVRHVRRVGKLTFLILYSHSLTVKNKVFFTKDFCVQIVSKSDLISIIDDVNLLRTHQHIRAVGLVRQNTRFVDKQLFGIMNCCRWELSLLSVELLTNKRPIKRISNGYNMLDSDVFERFDGMRRLRWFSDVKHRINEFFVRKNFVNIDTPILSFSSKEGSGLFCVDDGKFFLSQSPQIYKQTLITCGVKKYFQIAKCFRNEDLREDRQYEFLQLDYEIMYADEHALRNITFQLIDELFLYVNDRIYQCDVTYHTMDYSECLRLYGCDRPDVRFTVRKMPFERHAAFQTSFCKISLRSLTAEELQKYTAVITAYLRNFSLEVNVVFSDDFSGFQASGQQLQLQHVTIATSKLLHVFRRDNVIVNDVISVVWLTNFPMFCKLQNDVKTTHHPFTNPVDKTDFLSFDCDNDSTDRLLTIRSQSYDLVVNGVEIGSGSTRITDVNVHRKMQQILDIHNDKSFRIIDDNLTYGTPKHSGNAIGLGRLYVHLFKLRSMRHSNAFPKNSNGECMLDDSFLN